MELLVVGTGFGRQWLVNANFTEHWNVAGVVARSEESLRKVGKDFTIPEDRQFRSIATAVEAHPEIDAIVVATPNETHLELALETLRLGKHLILEKPIVMNIPEAQILFAEIEKRPEIQVMVGHTMRGSALFRAVRDAIRGGIIGRVEMVNMRASARWLGDPLKAWRFGLDDIMLDDIGIHQFDMLRMLLQDRKCLDIFARVYNPSWYPLPTRTTCSALLEMEDIIHVNYFSTLAATGENTLWIGNFSIMGQDGSIFTTRDSAYAVLNDAPKKKVPIQPEDEDEPEGLAYLLEDFHEAIVKRRPPFSGIRNNIHSFNIIQAAKRSAELQRPVNLPREILKDWMGA